MISKIWAKLRDPEYRKAFVASQINIGIPFQIRALMKSGGRNWTQEELARRTGMLQPRISAILKPGKTRLNIETLRRIAEAFDCGLLVRFVPFSELARWSDSFNPDDFAVLSFNEDAPSAAGSLEARLAMMPASPMQRDFVAQGRQGITGTARYGQFLQKSGAVLQKSGEKSFSSIRSGLAAGNESAAAGIGR